MACVDGLLLGFLIVSVTGSVQLLNESEKRRYIFVEDGEDLMSDLIRRVVGEHFVECHLVIIASTTNSPVISAITRHLIKGAVIIVISSTVHANTVRDMWGTITTTCRTLAIDLSEETSSSAFSLLERSGLWKLPDTPVVVFGSRGGEAMLLHKSFRNIIHGFYLSFDTNFAANFSHWRRNLKPRLMHSKTPSEIQEITLYRRCLYCEGGEPSVRLVGKIHYDTKRQHQEHLYDMEDQFLNFYGHNFKVITVSYFPYIDYVKENEGGGARVILSDSLDTRILKTLISKLNVTYDIREEPQRSWGRETRGKFNGVVGQLQTEAADFSTMASLTPERLQVVWHARAYSADILTLVSLKPGLITQYFSITRAFRWEVWVGVLVCVFVWSLLSWELQRIWSQVTGGHILQLRTLILYSWGALLQQPLSNLCMEKTWKVMAAAWMTFSLISSSAFRSSLTAHLAVKGKSDPIDSFPDMLSRTNWRWGIESWMLKGVPYDYLSNHHSPTVQKIYKNMEVLSAEEGISKVLDGGYTFITVKNHISVVVASYYSDDHSRTLIYISNKGVYTLPDYGWGFRKGAPFYSRFRCLLWQLDETGIMSYWTKNVMADRVKSNKNVATRNSVNSKISTIQFGSGSSQVVLGVDHMQGIFYILLVGFATSVLIFLIEKFSHRSEVKI